MLQQYRKKRNFSNTPEPAGEKQSGAPGHRFVVQRHEASRLHYDFRLEFNGVLKSWAVPKGPSMNASDKRFAVQVEDHPVEYLKFKGIIPDGNYGAGKVDIWDKGTYSPVDEKGNALTDRQAAAWLKKGEFKFRIKGKKLAGEFVLVQLKKDPTNWLLIKHRDKYAVSNTYLADNEQSKPAKKKPVAKKTIAKNLATPPRPQAADRKLKQYHQPMLATLTDAAFDDKDWIFETKWDGYRAIAECDGKTLRLYSRNGLSFNTKYPSIVSALEKLSHNMVLDGEVVVLDAKGKPSFQLLQQFGDAPSSNICYYVFDLLSLHGRDTRELPVLQRKELLKKALPGGKKGKIRYCEHVATKGKSFFAKAVAMDLEGIIAKKADSEYHEGVRTKEWLKIKNHNSREAVIAGFTAPRGGRSHFGALILAEKKGKSFVYLGHTGTGFTEETLQSLWTKLQPLVTDSSPFAAKIKVNMPVTWVKPQLVCQVKFTEQTADGMLRHPVYLGLRVDKKASEVKQSNETPIKSKRR
ncbi:MAG TPA: non-homologous end-joining DNA ligase [Chitinophagaceae bacterium]|nr:non-homologous end-joining DNA ligase [Chitinophagaceae bacterium]